MRRIVILKEVLVKEKGRRALLAWVGISRVVQHFTTTNPMTHRLPGLCGADTLVREDLYQGTTFSRDETPNNQ